MNSVLVKSLKTPKPNNISITVIEEQVQIFLLFFVKDMDKITAVVFAFLHGINPWPISFFKSG